MGDTIPPSPLVRAQPLCCFEFTCCITLSLSRTYTQRAARLPLLFFSFGPVKHPGPAKERPREQARLCSARLPRCSPSTHARARARTAFCTYILTNTHTGPIKITTHHPSSFSRGCVASAPAPTTIIIIIIIIAIIIIMRCAYASNSARTHTRAHTHTPSPPLPLPLSSLLLLSLQPGVVSSSSPLLSRLLLYPLMPSTLHPSATSPLPCPSFGIRRSTATLTTHARNARSMRKSPLIITCQKSWAVRPRKHTPPHALTHIRKGGPLSQDRPPLPPSRVTTPPTAFS